MRVLYLLDDYADTLLALGIAAAFGVEPEYTGNSYIFPDTANFPIEFPAKTDGDPSPPFTFHERKFYTINALKGGKNFEKLSGNWNEITPEYEDVWRIILGDVEFRKTRFYDVPKRWSTAATFRPHQPKSEDPNKVVTTREVWVVDALRAIGFVTYATTIYLDTESPTSRYLVAVPAVPTQIINWGFHPKTRLNALCCLYASSARSQIPMIHVAQYAEMNKFSRTSFGQYMLMRPARMDVETAEQLHSILYYVAQILPPSDGIQMCKLLLNIIEGGRTQSQIATQLAKIVQQWNMQTIAMNGLFYVPAFSMSLVSRLATLHHD